MKSNKFKNKIGGAILGVSLLFGIGMMSSMTAQAQYRNDDQWRRNRDRDRDRDRDQRRRDDQDDRWDNRDDRNRDDQYDGYRDDRWYGRNRNGRTWDGYRNYGGSFELRQTALNAGYNEGIKEGRKHRRNGDRYEFRDEGAYQKATKDYSSRLGDRWLYQRYFREAFENGYRAGYNGY